MCLANKYSISIKKADISYGNVNKSTVKNV